jgi:hypothetical protein
VSTGFLDILRQCRRPLIAIAIALVVLQTLVTGIALAQSATSLEPFDAGVICHAGGDGSTSTSDLPSDSHKALCCVFCIATAPALLPAAPPVTQRLALVAQNGSSAASQDIVLIARRAVRAGPSHAPPSLV